MWATLFKGIGKLKQYIILLLSMVIAQNLMVADTKYLIHRPLRITLVLTWKYHSDWIICIALRGSMYTARGETYLSVLPSCESYETQKQLALKDRSTHVIVAQNLWE